MRRNMPGTPAYGAQRSRRLLLRPGQGALVLLALFIAFEVGSRHVPPDGMTVKYGCGVPNRPMCIYTSPKDQQAINDYYAAFNRAPVRLNLPEPVINGCFNEDASYVVFTWHGMPVESWTYDGCEEYIENAGGVSDAYILTHHDAPDIAMPVPPPSDG